MMGEYGPIGGSIDWSPDFGPEVVIDRPKEQLKTAMETLSDDQAVKHLGEGWAPVQSVATQPKEQVPSIGRVVHYHSYGTPKGEYLPKPIAAIITQVNDDGTVGLCIFNPTGLFFNTNVPYDQSDTLPGHWSWPPR
jgi:hypothetical protein